MYLLGLLDAYVTLVAMLRSYSTNVFFSLKALGTGMDFQFTYLENRKACWCTVIPAHCLLLTLFRVMTSYW